MINEYARRQWYNYAEFYCTVDFTAVKRMMRLGLLSILQTKIQTWKVSL